MPLSEHEQRQLDQIERALYAEDPKFVHSVRANDPRVHYKRRAIKAVFGFLLGVGLLLTGVILKVVWVGVIGFLVMLACCMLVLTSWKRMSSPRAEPAAAPGKPSQKRSARAHRPGFMERLEERWRRRQEGDDR